MPGIPLPLAAFKMLKSLRDIYEISQSLECDPPRAAGPWSARQIAFSPRPPCVWEFVGLAWGYGCWSWPTRDNPRLPYAQRLETHPCRNTH
eukprot:1354940-Amorphochlora_amoeboformis.AAC.2